MRISRHWLFNHDKQTFNAVVPGFIVFSFSICLFVVAIVIVIIVLSLSVLIVISLNDVTLLSSEKEIL
jgi:hypothetical protein